MTRTVGVVAVAVTLLTGCSSPDETATGLAGEVQRLEAEISALKEDGRAAAETVEAQGEGLEEAQIAADEVAAREPDPCCEELAKCCGTTIGPPNQVVPGEATIWNPPHSGYQTESPEITVVIVAPDGVDVTVNGLMTQAENWAGTDSTYTIEIPLDQGPNRLDLAIDDRDITWTVIRDSSLERRYGRVLDPRHDALGIDYGDMDLEPDYGAGDFDPGEVVVEFGDLAASTAVIAASPYSSKVIVTGRQAIVDFFLNDSPTTDVWSVLLNGNTIVHLEGPIPLGD